ncbi:hypothetical protein PH30N_11879 [Cutibacterium modestum 30N]|jgi:hypothetical protein|nr:hypothetical protein HMPREF9621_01526 [Cutibacterium modestum HL037PA2]EFS92570.1 hypothetical protein HMPREF9607_01100 [Cutibacterium modestum HL044PA1]EFT15322.1 hypothetical protein HMPREF9622_01688 [Cutibacterium modestum HL037PA3]MCP2381644.1 hypothetical protein [Cutibacterium modestum 30N]
MKKLMTKQEFILTLISAAIVLVSLVPTLIYKVRKERNFPTCEPAPMTQGATIHGLAE